MWCGVGPMDAWTTWAESTSRSRSGASGSSWGEIENALLAHPGVHKAAVAAQSRLIGYVEGTAN